MRPIDMEMIDIEDLTDLKLLRNHLIYAPMTLKNCRKNSRQKFTNIV